MSKLDAIMTGHSMLNLTTTKAKRKVKDLMIEMVGDSEPEPFTVEPYEAIKTQEAKARNSLRASLRQEIEAL